MGSELGGGDGGIAIWMGVAVGLGTRGDKSVYKYFGVFLVVADGVFCLVANSGGIPVFKV